MAGKYIYIVNRRFGKGLGSANSLEGAKKKILKDGQLLTKYDVFRVSKKKGGTSKETRFRTYQLKLTGYQGRGPLKLVASR